MFRRIAYAVGFAATAVLDQAASPHASHIQARKVDSCDFHVFVAPPERFRITTARARKVICDRLSGLPGGQVAVAVDGRIVWSAGFGRADIEKGNPVTPNTMFRIGSISKPLTAYAVASAVESGRLDLDLPIQRYVPAFPRKKWTVTSRQVAGHVAGIRGYVDDYAENRSAKSYPTVTSGLSIFAGDSLLFQPGSRFSYSTYGYSLLSAALEGATGLDFVTLMTQRVFGPLHLSHTAIDNPYETIQDRAQSYHLDSGRVSIAPFVDNSYKWAGGGMLSTAEDLARFGSIHVRPGIMSKRSQDLVLTSMRTTDGQETGYGIGWYVGKDRWGHPNASHTGSAIGGSSILVVDRGTGVVFSMCLNVTGTDAVGELLSPVWSEIPALFELGPRADRLLDAFNKENPDAVASAYRAASDTASGLAWLVENYLNELGYKKMGEKDLPGALMVFELNTTTFPNAFNTWDSFAEALAMAGDTAKSIQYYKKSLELNRENHNAERMLDRLRSRH